jgi:hypothetical protein
MWALTFLREKACSRTRQDDRPPVKPPAVVMGRASGVEDRRTIDGANGRQGYSSTHEETRLMIDMAIRRYTLPLAHPFTIARGTIVEKETIVVQLHEDGLFGYGEAPAHEFYGATIERMTAGLSALAPQLATIAGHDPWPPPGGSIQRRGPTRASRSASTSRA